MAIKLHRRYLCLHCQNVCFRRRRKKGRSCLGRPTYLAWGCEALLGEMLGLNDGRAV